MHHDMLQEGLPRGRHSVPEKILTRFVEAVETEGPLAKLMSEIDAEPDETMAHMQRVALAEGALRYFALESPTARWAEDSGTVASLRFYHDVVIDRASDGELPEADRHKVLRFQKFLQGVFLWEFETGRKD